MSIEVKKEGGLIYRDSQGNKLMESFPDGVNWMEEVEEIEKNRQQAHEEFDEEFPQLKPDGTVEGPLTITSGHMHPLYPSLPNLKNLIYRRAREGGPGGIWRSMMAMTTWNYNQYSGHLTVYSQITPGRILFNHLRIESFDLAQQIAKCLHHAEAMAYDQGRHGDEGFTVAELKR